MPMSEWLTPAEAGAILGIGPDRVAQLAKAARIGFNAHSWQAGAAAARFS